MGIKLFLDDIRKAPSKHWQTVTSYKEFTEQIKDKQDNLPEEISFDHDLGDINGEKEYTGYDCAKWLVEYCIDFDLDLPKFKVHSANPVGGENILKYLNNYKVHRKKDIDALRARVRKSGEIGGEMIDDVWVPTLDGLPITNEIRKNIIDDMGRYKKLFT